MTQIPDNIVHFETLWQSSEELALSIHNDASLSELFHKIKNILDGINEIDRANIGGDIQCSIKRRVIGGTVFLFTRLSAKKNIAVYAALAEPIFSKAFLLIK